MKNQTLLYVDDEDTNLVLFELSFSKYFKIITTNSTDTALEIIKTQPVKAVISDYKMPKMNGMELIEQIKQLKPEITCIILSGYVEADVVTDKSLLHSFILKPWKRQEMIETISAILG